MEILKTILKMESYIIDELAEKDLIGSLNAIIKYLSVIFLNVFIFNSRKLFEVETYFS